MGDMSGMRFVPEKDEGREGRLFLLLEPNSFGCLEEDLSSVTSPFLFLELAFSSLNSKLGFENMSKLDRS